MNTTQPATPAASVRVMQIIAFALIQGLLLFGAFAIYKVQQGGPPQPGFNSYVAAGFAVLMLAAFAFYRIPAKRSQLPPDVHDARSDAVFMALAPIYQTSMIVRFACLEGAGFFNLAVYTAEHNWWSLGIAAALVLVMLTKFPTRTRIDQWVESEYMRLTWQSN